MSWLKTTFCIFALLFTHAQASPGADWTGKSIQLAALDSPSGPPPCGADGICNVAACSQDPDCPDLPGNPSPPPSTSSPSRPSDIKDCSAQETTEIGLAIDWGASNWNAFEAVLEDIRDWPVSIGNCLENRFKDNGKVVCEGSMKGDCKNANGWASYFNKKCHMCPDFLSKIRKISGKANRQACYFALVTHEWGHTCDRGHKTLEIIDDEAFDFWKSKHSDVTISFSDCGMR